MSKMEQMGESTPLSQGVQETNGVETLASLRTEAIRLAKQATEGLFTKRGLKPLNDFKGDVEFRHLSLGVVGLSSARFDGINISEHNDHYLNIYIHEMIHAHTNMYKNPENRMAKSGISSDWTKTNEGRQGVSYFNALNEALTEILMDEAVETVPLFTQLELMQKLLVAKEAQIKLDLEKELTQYGEEIKRLEDQFRDTPETWAWSEEDNKRYEEWVGAVLSLKQDFPEFYDAPKDTSKEYYEKMLLRIRRHTEEEFLQRIHNLKGLCEDVQKLAELELDLVRIQIESGFSPEKSYLLERKLVNVIVDKIASLKNQTSEVIIEEMKTAYLQGNSLYFRIIGKVLGVDTLETVAKLDTEDFEPTEEEVAEAVQKIPDSVSEDRRSMYHNLFAKKIAKKRVYKNLIEKIEAIAAPQE